MNMVLGVIIVYLNGSIDEAHAVGAYPDKHTCAVKVTEALQAWLPKASLAQGAEVYIYCRDLSDSKAKADAAAKETK